jgi:anti-anti-sigma factor
MPPSSQTRTTPLVEIRVSEPLDARTAVDVSGLLEDAVAQRPMQLIVDLAECEYVDATGVILLVDTHRRVWQDGGRMTLRGLSPRLRRILEIARVDRVLHTGPLLAETAANRPDSEVDHGMVVVDPADRGARRIAHSRHGRDPGSPPARPGTGGRRPARAEEPMTRIVCARDLAGRPVVTFDGDDIAQIKDVVYAATNGSVIGFTLAGRKLLSGPKPQMLRWKDVHAVGRHAVMVTDTERLIGPSDFDTDPAGGADVLGDTVLTVGGTALGTVTDVLVDIGGDADVVGFEIVTTDALPPAGRRALIPRTSGSGVSGEAIVVSDTSTGFVTSDLAGFVASLSSWRSRESGVS